MSLDQEKEIRSPIDQAAYKLSLGNPLIHKSLHLVAELHPDLFSDLRSPIRVEDRFRGYLLAKGIELPREITELFYLSEAWQNMVPTAKQLFESLQKEFEQRKNNRLPGLSP